MHRTPLSERLEQATHLVVIVTTLETPKKIFCYNNNIMRNDNFKQDHLGQEHYEQPYKVFYRFLDVLNIKTVTKQVWFYFICGTTRLRYMGTIMTLQIVLNTPKNLYLNQATPQKNISKFFYPVKSRNHKFQTQKNPSIIPFLLPKILTARQIIFFLLLKCVFTVTRFPTNLFSSIPSNLL